MPIKKNVLFISLVFFFLASGHYALASNEWLSIKDKHFILFYNFKEDTAAASRVLRKAEDYYNKVASQIGYSRYANFWTWEERVKIIIFPDQKTFMQETHQPIWSRGFADDSSELFKTRIIVTYRQEENFLEGLLPHEISHLILRDFIGFDKDIPVWFDEGVAQLQEKNKMQNANRLMKSLVKRKKHIPISILSRLSIYREKDPQTVKVFYAQSLSMIDFMIRKYGSSSFAYLCRNLKDGKSFEEALSGAYSYAFKSLDDLENKWIRSMM